MRKLPKIHGRPLLPWWVYIGYFLLLVILSIAQWASSQEEDMRPAKGKEATKAKHGRRGDTELAHVNPYEMAVLKAMGGAGTRNPKTGHKEFYDGSDYATGGGGRASVTDTPSDYGGSGGYSFGGGAAGYGVNAPTNQSVNIGDYTAPGYDPSRGSGFRADGPGGDWSIDMGAAPQTTTQQGFLDRVNSYLQSALNPSKPSALAPSSRTLYEGMRLLGGNVGKPLNEMFGGTAVAEDRSYPSMALSEGPANDYMDKMAGVQPAVTPASFARPEAMDAPLSLGISPGMNDLQRRSRIATYGTQGNQSQFRTPEAMRYYGNLIARALIGGNNQVPQSDPGLLPVEQEYLRQQYGVNQSNNAQQLIEALRPYWSR